MNARLLVSVCLSLAACGGAQRASTSQPSVALPPAALDAGAALDAESALVPDNPVQDAGSTVSDAFVSDAAVVVAEVPLPEATPLPRGVEFEAEVGDNGVATLVLRNGAPTPLRVGAFAAVEQYVAGSGRSPFIPVENVLLSLNPGCRAAPECITLARGQSLRAPVWPGTQCPSTQCESSGCRHVGAGIYRFVARRCGGGTMYSAPFRLTDRRPPVETQ